MIKGFYLTVGNKGFFLKSSANRKSKKNTQRMIQQICIYRGFCVDMIDRCMNDPECIKKIQRDTSPAVLESITTASGYSYYAIKGSYFQESFPVDDFEKDVIVFS